jgi:hypothetical protein
VPGFGSDKKAYFWIGDLGSVGDPDTRGLRADCHAAQVDTFHSAALWGRQGQCRAGLRVGGEPSRSRDALEPVLLN